MYHNNAMNAAEAYWRAAAAMDLCSADPLLNYSGMSRI
jgi:hypothetical protein